ncbi:VanZ family protein [Demequina pelophila]|uniref:VanZ family protein n=1 Tax=Demequina pelophila TaxID=1638984 RepID=UPI0009E1EE1F
MQFAVPYGAESSVPYAAVGLGLTLLAAVLGTMRGRGARAALWAALVACLAVIGWLTIGDTLASSHTGAASVNLTPFQEIDRALNSQSQRVWLNLIGNVAMFMPLGAVIAALIRRGFWLRVLSALFAGVVLSVGIEMAQYTLGRVADIDDVLLNSAGALLGGLVVAVLVGGVELARRGRARARRNYHGRRASSSVGRAADF